METTELSFLRFPFTSAADSSAVLVVSPDPSYFLLYRASRTECSTSYPGGKPPSCLRSAQTAWARLGSEQAGPSLMSRESPDPH